MAAQAPRAELVRALEEKMERYHALREAVTDDDQIKTDIEVILGRASAMLRLAKQQPSPGAAPAAARSAPTREAAASAPARQSSPARAATPAASTSAPEPLNFEVAPEPELVLAEADEEVLLPVEEEAAEIALPLPPERVAEARAPESRPASETGEQASGPGSTTFEGRAKIEHLLMEGEVRMTVSDYANAITVYEKLVEAAPKVPAYRMRLAVAMACYPRTAKHAEREFVEAMRLDPDNGDYHYQFGLYFKAMKVKSRAVAEMRTAVRLSPRHQAAREELQSMSPRDSVLSSLRNLFK